MLRTLLAIALLGMLGGVLGGCANQAGNQLQLGSAGAQTSGQAAGNPLATKVLATLAVERVTGKPASFSAAERPARQRTMLVAAN